MKLENRFKSTTMSSSINYCKYVEMLQYDWL